MAILLQACITTLVVAWNLPGDYYYTLRDFIVLIALIFGMGLTSAVLMIYGVEFSEVMFNGGWKRAYKRATPLPADQEPFVSIHLACYNEPPDMVITTIESLAKLNYRHYEVLVIDNNTKDEGKWKPLEAYMAKMPDNFHFFHLPQLSLIHISLTFYATRTAMAKLATSRLAVPMKSLWLMHAKRQSC